MKVLSEIQQEDLRMKRRETYQDRTETNEVEKVKRVEIRDYKRENELERENTRLKEEIEGLKREIDGLKVVMRRV